MEEYKIPAEHQPLPPEHSVPEEFPVSKPQPTKKKKSNARRLMAVMVSSFMVLQVMFSYFVPPTGNPGYTEPNQGGLPDQDQTGFKIHAMANHVEDTYLKAGLQEAGEYFEDLDYIRASLKMMDALCEFSMDYNPRDLNHVAYGFHNSAIEDFDGSAVNGCYFYFTHTTVMYEDEKSAMEYDALNAYIVSFEERANGTYYRVIEAMYELPYFVAYGMSYDWSANIYYYEGVLDDAGNSSDFKHVAFEANNIGEYRNVDGMYKVAAFLRFMGPAGGYAFLNGTELSSWLLYDDAARDFVLNQQMQDSVFHANWLTADGKLDLTHSAVMDATSGVDDTLEDDFRSNDALDVLAGPDYFILKATVDRQYEVEYSGEYLDRPLFPLDISTARNIKRFIEWQSGQTDPGEEYDPNEEFSTNLRLEELDDDANLDSMKAYLGQACEKFFAGDYVSSSLLCRGALKELSAFYGSDHLYNTALVWKDGTVSIFDGQDLRDGSGVYVFFYVTHEKYVGKESVDIYTYPFLNMTLLISNKNGSNDDVRMMHLKLEQFFMMTDISGCDVTYLETTFRNGYYANDVELIHFTATTVYNWNESQSREDTFGSSYIRGDIKQDHVCGNVEFIEYGCVLSTDQTKYEKDPYSTVIKIQLDHDGRLDIDGMGLLHYKQADGQDYQDMIDVFNNNPSYPGYVYSYEQYGLLMLMHPEDSKQDYWREFVETDPLFTTGRSIEFWRMLQQHIK